MLFPVFSLLPPLLRVTVRNASDVMLSGRSCPLLWCLAKIARCSPWHTPHSTEPHGAVLKSWRVPPPHAKVRQSPLKSPVQSLHIGAAGKEARQANNMHLCDLARAGPDILLPVPGEREFAAIESLA